MDSASTKASSRRVAYVRRRMLPGTSECKGGVARGQVKVGRWPRGGGRVMRRRRGEEEEREGQERGRKGERKGRGGEGEHHLSRAKLKEGANKESHLGVTVEVREYIRGWMICSQDSRQP